MVNTQAEALGIIFPNSYDSLIPELASERSMASIPFAGRYRLCDFMISCMVHAGISNISLVVRNNYHSLMDHLGSGREWDLARKKGGLNIFPPYAQKNLKVYNGRIEALESIKGFLETQHEKYVVMADANMALNIDFKDLIREHMESGADLSMVYRKQEIPHALLYPNSNFHEFYYTFDIENQRVRKIFVNPRETGIQNFSFNMFVIEREMLVRMIDEAYVHGYTFFTRDIIARHVGDMNVHAYEYTGYAAQINSVKSYFEENMRLLDEENLNQLFRGNSIYTKVRDDNPTRYINGSKVKNCLVSDGCIIEGEIENCVLFRGVKIKKGATVKNCVIFQDTVVGENSHLEYIITDKNVTISPNKYLSGNDSFQVYVAKGQTV
ncbi:MAG: glucose-1-phosphate adenylyltransferase subunit GlgD [Agathobacter sp.]|uniref:glucose-1-phosphate adenylyltransferase subunit GlgD n=1 Tax=Agathobacter sp. TaxID=2021311 RepID=UPI00258F331A|nr:glucose-1-phosphate adenylyltransferase subunit GlgD [Agathobacter sp.]MCR5678301.1 glucose-1-phosphate adenylyltransferase subunit GlgD [Agathobacter sp.]